MSRTLEEMRFDLEQYEQGRLRQNDASVPSVTKNQSPKEAIGSWLRQNGLSERSGAHLIPQIVFDLRKSGVPITPEDAHRHFRAVNPPRFR